MAKKKKKKKKARKAEEKSLSDFWINVIAVSAVLVALMMALCFPLTNEEVKLDLVFLDVTLSDTPVELTSTYKGSFRKTRRYEFKVEEYPNNRFLLTGASYRLCSSAILDDFAKDSTIQIGILKESMSKLHPSFLNTTIDTTNVKWNIISIFDLAYLTDQSATVYLHKQNVEDWMSKNRKDWVSFIGYFLMLVVVSGIVWFIKGRS